MQNVEELTVTTSHLRRNLPAILAKVEGGRISVLLTHHGRPVCRLEPIEPQDDASSTE